TDLTARVRLDSPGEAPYLCANAGCRSPALGSGPPIRPDEGRRLRSAASGRPWLGEPAESDMAEEVRREGASDGRSEVPSGQPGLRRGTRASISPAPGRPEPPHSPSRLRPGLAGLPSEPRAPVGPSRCWGQRLSLVSGQVSSLMKATVLMRQPGRVQEIVGALRRGGGDRLQVISDFDMTLSRFAYNGKRCPTSYNILDNSKIISEECQKELSALLHHYYPIEIDPHRTVKEKLPYMVEWWTKAHNLLCQQKIQKHQIAQVVQESSAMLREGYRTFFNTLHQNGIPLFIFSAGIGDILEEIIRQMKVFHPNIHIVSNYMDFDEDGFLQGFRGQLIHTYNKNISVCENSSYFQKLQGKTNILLLGDSMGDLTMADGIPGVENILKIGFLNDKVQESRQLYLDSYDIVLEKDETLDVVNELLQHILSQEDRKESQGS
ncbi:7-methylguanosine phosphate-specific 5'-nucleotidase, partial [Galemys pyrenaicus]